MDLQLTDKKAIVTGASRGSGPRRRHAWHR
jgi:hypothetical protein